jgi:methionine salvage enolase-phosphatase E1
MAEKFILDSNIKSVICDIEGTTTSISFVKVNIIFEQYLMSYKYYISIKIKDVLFPYARNHVKKYLEDNFDNETCRNDIKLLIEQVFGYYYLTAVVRKGDFT